MISKKVFFATLIILNVIIYSCSDDDDGEVIVDDNNSIVVETLVANFEANDGLHVANDGLIYASNWGAFNSTTGKGNGTKIFQVTPEGVVTLKGDGLVAPMQGVLDSEGNFYFTQENEGVAGEIIKLTSSGEKIVLGEIEGWPSGMAIDSNDNIYVANLLAPTLHKITPDGDIALMSNDSLLEGCVGIDLDSEGNIIASNYNNGEIVKILSSGEVSLLASIDEVVENFGIGYMTIFENAIYATGIGNNRIYKVSMDGVVERFTGTRNNASIDGELSSASFSAPNGIASDPVRRVIYISEFGQPNLRVIRF